MIRCGRCTPVRGIISVVMGYLIKKRDYGGEMLILFLRIKNPMERTVSGAEETDGSMQP